MIVDTSALVAILRQESDAENIAATMAAAEIVRMSAATLVECHVVIQRLGALPLEAALDLLLQRVGMQVVSFDTSAAQIAADAHRRFGRGSGHPARLNFGDCFAYALAKATGEPLLFKGTDFGHTDVTPALPG